MSEHDGELLDRLRAALAVAPTGPSADDVTALRDLVDEHRERTPAPVALHAGALRRRGRRAVAAAALAATLVVASGAIAVATNGPFSGTARRAASALGLPIDSPELYQAKDALETLSVALAGHDDRQVAEASRDLSRRLAELSGDDARVLGHEAEGLLREADERLGVGHDNGGAQQPGGTGRGGGGASPDERGSGHDGTGRDRASGGDLGSVPNRTLGSGSGSDNPSPATPSGSPQIGSGSDGSGSGDSGTSGDGTSDGGSGGGGDSSFSP
jgi:hypothetical protein